MRTTVDAEMQFPAGPPRVAEALSRHCEGELAPSGGSEPRTAGSPGPSGSLERTGALIFDMDGTMVDSMPWHAKSWVGFMQRHGIRMELSEVMRRTNGRNGAECMRILFERELDDSQAWALIAEKEAIYREIFSPIFTEVAGFSAFERAARDQGLKIGVGTAGDRHNVAFVLEHLKLPAPPHAIVGGDEGLPGKPAPAIFLEVASRLGHAAESCIVFEDAPLGIEAARRAGMRAVAICTSHSAAELDGPHVIANARNFDELIENHFLETLHVATA